MVQELQFERETVLAFDVQNVMQNQMELLYKKWATYSLVGSW